MHPLDPCSIDVQLAHFLVVFWAFTGAFSDFACGIVVVAAATISEPFGTAAGAAGASAAAAAIGVIPRGPLRANFSSDSSSFSAVKIA